MVDAFPPQSNADDFVRLTPEETGLDEGLLAALATRTQHRAPDGTPRIWEGQP